MTDEKLDDARTIAEMREELRQVRELKWFCKCACSVVLCYVGGFFLFHTGGAFGDVLILVGLWSCWRLCRKGF